MTPIGLTESELARELSDCRNKIRDWMLEQLQLKQSDYAYLMRLVDRYASRFTIAAMTEDERLRNSIAKTKQDRQQRVLEERNERHRRLTGYNPDAEGVVIETDSYAVMEARLMQDYTAQLERVVREAWPS